MARDILSEYGPDHKSSKGETGRSGLTTDGGKPYCGDVKNYKHPQGPTSIGNRGVGLGGTVHPKGSQK